ncbi:MAG: hypothetical protein HY664_06140 [Chloroflexi bacterium]|nr:hypothetical protein [Chloroflexota bacterium]
MVSSEREIKELTSTAFVGSVAKMGLQVSLFFWLRSAGLVAISLFLIACSSDKGTRASPTAMSAPTATPFVGTRGPVEKPSPVAPPVALLTDVRVGRHEGFDRVVFEFKGSPPGYRIEYIQPPIVQDASGLPVEIEGLAFLKARFYPASEFDLEHGVMVYTGPTEIKPDLPSLLEVERSGDFEAVLTWVLGLRQEVDFRVAELQDPLRVVIDVAYP